MKSFLLATGEKNALTDINRQLPSPMLPLINRPAMMYSVELLYRHGLRDIFVSLYNSGEEIEEYFGSGERWGVDFTYLLQREALGAAGTLRQAQYHIDDTFIVLPADSIINFDIHEALANHKSSGRIATFVLHESPDFPIQNNSVITLDTNDTVTSAEVGAAGHPNLEDRDRNGAQRYLNTGVCIFEPEILSYIPIDSVFDCHTDLIGAFQNAGKPVNGYVTSGYWNPLDTYQSFQHAQYALLKRLNDGPPAAVNAGVPYTYIYDQEYAPGVWYGKNTKIHPEARIYPPVHIGQDSQLLARSTIGPNVVIGSQAVVGRDTTVKDSTVLDNTYIESTQKIQHRVVAKNVIINTETDEEVPAASTGAIADISPTLFSKKLSSILEKLLATVLLVCIAPLLAVIALILLVRSGQPIVTVVSKMGYSPNSTSAESSSSKHLRLTHFRTRVEDGAETKFGSWLERYELHRLPELWNVIMGDIGLVGTEPLTEDEVNQLNEEWEKQRFRCTVGFTGFWYTQTDPNSTLVERCAVDAYYAATRSSYVDLVQLILTPIAWVKRIGHKASESTVTGHFKGNESANRVALGSD